MLRNPINVVPLLAMCALTLLVPVVGARGADAQPPADAPSGRNNPSSLVDRMMAFDKNHDGKLTRDEITDRRFLKLFDRADANKDGVITREELEAMAAQMNAGEGPDGNGPGGPPPRAGQDGRGQGGPNARGGPNGPGPGGMGPPPQGPPPDGPGGPNGPDDAGGPPAGDGPGGFGPPPPGPPGGRHGRGPGGPPPQGPPGGPDGQDAPGGFGPPPQGQDGPGEDGPNGPNGPGGPTMHQQHQQHRGRQQGGSGGAPMQGQQGPPVGGAGPDSQQTPAADSPSATNAQGSDKASAMNADLSKMPPTAETANVTFSKDIRPLLQASCMRCHGSGRVKGGLHLDSLNGVLAGGEDGKVVIAGDSKNSPLVIAVAQINDDTAMPPKHGPGGGQAGRGGAAKPLTADQVGLVRAWIEQGAK